jgi:chemotaxis protein CheC
MADAEFPGPGRLLTILFERGAEESSKSLSQWLGRPIHLAVSAVEQVDLEEAGELLGPGDTLIASCAMELSGPLTGLLVLVFEDRSGLALVDLLMGQPVGTAASWGELEQSAAKETANIVGCAFLNSLAAHLPASVDTTGQLLPGPPVFRHEFAASLIEFAMVDQAIAGDRVLAVRSRFESEGNQLDWSLMYVPTARALRTLGSLDPSGARPLAGA